MGKGEGIINLLMGANEGRSSEEVLFHLEKLWLIAKKRRINRRKRKNSFLRVIFVGRLVDDIRTYYITAESKERELLKVLILTQKWILNNQLLQFRI